MKEIELKINEKNTNIYPVIYEEGLLFKKDDNYYLFKNNKILKNERIFEGKEVVVISIPDNFEDVQTIENIINFLFLRLSTAYLENSENKLLKEFKEIITDIKIENEKTKKILIKNV